MQGRIKKDLFCITLHFKRANDSPCFGIQHNELGGISPDNEKAIAYLIESHGVEIGDPRQRPSGNHGSSVSVDNGYVSSFGDICEKKRTTCLELKRFGRCVEFYAVHCMQIFCVENAQERRFIADLDPELMRFWLVARCPHGSLDRGRGYQFKGVGVIKSDGIVLSRRH